MIDKRLFRLLGENRRYVGYCVALQLASLAASLTVTACLCRAIYLAAQKNFPETGAFLSSLQRALPPWLCGIWLYARQVI